MTGARIENHHAGDPVEVAAVCLHVGVRSHHALLFSGEKNEADGTTGFQAGSFDGAQGVDNEGGIAAIVESAGAEFPGIQVGGENDHFIRLLAALDFSNDVCGLDGPADFVRDGEIGRDGQASGHETSYAFTILAGDQNLGNTIDLAMA